MALDVWAGAPSCWNAKGFPENMVLERSCITGSNISSQYVWVSIFTATGTNMSYVRPVDDIPAQTMTEGGFCIQLTYRSSSGVDAIEEEMIRSF